MRILIAKTIAVLILTLAASALAWLVLSGILSFALLQWRAITAVPTGRLIFAAIVLVIFLKVCAAPVEDDK